MLAGCKACCSLLYCLLAATAARLLHRPPRREALPRPCHRDPELHVLCLILKALPPACCGTTQHNHKLLTNSYATLKRNPWDMLYRWSRWLWGDLSLRITFAPCAWSRTYRIGLRLGRVRCCFVGRRPRLPFAVWFACTNATRRRRLVDKGAECTRNGVA